MANNCLVTKLKSVVNNDNLPYLEYVTLKISKDTSIAGGSYIQIDNKEAITVESVGGNHLSTTSGGEKTNIVNIGAHQYGGTRTDIYFDNDDYVIRINKKYIHHIRYIWVGATKILSCDVSQFAYCMASSDVASSSVLNLGSSGVRGDIGKLANIDMMITNLTAANSNICGNIVGMSGSLRLENLGAQGTEIVGEIRELAIAMVNKGRTSGTLIVQCNDYITLDSVVVGNNVSKTITFDSSLPNGYSIA